ncbi:MAG: TrkA family potassium uptake protein [Tissierellaceae bacterium]
MKSFAVIGCGRFGSSIAKTLFDIGNEVLAVDKNPELVKEISEHVTYAVEADVMDESVLKELGLSNFDVVIISIGSSLEASIMATLIVKEFGVKKVVAKAQSELHGKLLAKIGADKVVFPERDMGVRVAHKLTSNNILDYIELSPDFSILEIAAIKSWYNKSLEELKFRNRYGVNVIAIKDKNNISISLDSEQIVREGNILVIIGTTEDVKKIELMAAE